MSKEEKRKCPSAPSVRMLCSYWKNTHVCPHLHKHHGFSIQPEIWDSDLDLMAEIIYKCAFLSCVHVSPSTHSALAGWTEISPEATDSLHMFN